MISLVLKQIDLFRSLDHQSLQRIWETAEEVDARPGEVIFYENDFGDEVYAIVNGRVDIEMTLPGGFSTEVIATLKQGEIFGEPALAGHDRRSASARARGQVHLLRWRAADLMRVVWERPQSGVKLMNQLAVVLSERLASTTIALRNELARNSLSRAY